MRSLLSLLLCFLSLSLFSQNYSVSGKVTDKENRQPLAFVNIIVNEGQYGGISDINGKFEINSKEPIQTMKFSCLGYESLEIKVEKGDTRVNAALKPTTFQLNEVTVEAGENPAHRIIDSVMAHRKENNPNSLPSYRYHIYDQMVITIDSSDFGKVMDTVSEKMGLSRLDSLLKRSDLMIMETYSEVLYRSPNQMRQNVLGTKMSGSKDPQVVYLANKMQSSSFYDEKVSIAGTDYVNPISRNSKTHYFFTLESVSPANDGDSLYQISFHPMKGSVFNGLRGTMTIHSDGWAVQSVKAAPNQEGDGLFKINIQQLYQKINGHWFPSQLNTNLVFPSVQASVDNVSFPMIAIGKSYVSDVEMNIPITNRAFSEVEVQVHEAAGYRDDAFWTQHRIDSLTERILNTYHLMDSLTRGNNIFDRILSVTDKLMDDMSLGLGPIDWNLGSLFRYSFTRGCYFGLHLTTNDRLSRHLRIGGFLGYWTRLHDIDYGFEGKWLIDRQRQMELGVRYAHKSLTLGEFNGFGESNNPLSENEYRYVFYENVLIRSNITEAFFNTRFARHFKAFLTFGTYQKKYLPPYDALPITHFTIAELKLRFAYKEKFLGTAKGIRSLGTDYPVVWLSYQHSFKDVLGGEYDYDRFKFQLEKDFQTKYIGKSSVLLQAGYASKGCPVQETFDLLGSYQLVGLYSPGSFSTMREDEFLCNRFVALFLSHDFQGTLWHPHSQWFKPQLCVATNLGWGLPTMKHCYFESGFVVRGLLSMPLVNMGAGVFYRYGAYSFPKVIDNFAFKYSITFSL